MIFVAQLQNWVADLPIEMKRRAFLAGLGALLATPLVPAPVRAWAARRQYDLLAPGTISDIVATALRNRSAALAANLMRNNTALERLQDAG